MRGAWSVLIFVLVAISVASADARVRLASSPTPTRMGRRPSPYSAIKNNLQDMADTLLGLPKSGVWVHEKMLYKVIGATSGDKFGQRDCMSCLLEGVDKGYWGNKRRDCVLLRQGAMTGFSHENSKYSIAYQNYGDDELFPAGNLDMDPIVGRSRWFRSGETLVVNVRDQLDIVEELMGETPELDDEVALRRQNNYTSFVKGVEEDGGYARFDVPYVAYKHRDIWGEGIVANPKYAYMRRAFKPKDMAKIEKYMRLMIIASNKFGKLEVRDGELVPSGSARAARGDVHQERYRSNHKRSEFFFAIW